MRENNGNNRNRRVVRMNNGHTNQYNRNEYNRNAHANRNINNRNVYSSRNAYNSRNSYSQNGYAKTAVRKKKKLNKKGKIVITIFTLLIFAVAALFVIMNTRFLSGKIGNLYEGIGTPKELRNKQVSFLLLGIADDEEEREKTRLTDLMAVVTLDFKNDTTKVLQIPRDTYIGEETPSGKMNAIYNRDPSYWDYSGLEGLSKMINEMFKLNIDHYVTMEMNGFRDIVDAIGGVTMNVPVDMELNGTYVKAGEQTLNGKQAIAVVRTRNAYSGGDDISRTKTQQEFMKAFVKEVLSLGTLKMTKIIPSCIKYVNTDITISEALKYYKGISAIDASKLEIFTLPGEGGNYYSNALGKQSVYYINKEETANMLNEHFRANTTSVDASELKIKSEGEL